MTDDLHSIIAARKASEAIEAKRIELNNIRREKENNAANAYVKQLIQLFENKYGKEIGVEIYDRRVSFTYDGNSYLSVISKKTVTIKEARYSSESSNYGSSLIEPGERRSYFRTYIVNHNGFLISGIDPDVMIGGAQTFFDYIIPILTKAITSRETDSVLYERFKYR